MLKVVGCFIDFHDHRLVVLAALVCALASWSAIQLLSHTQQTAGPYRFAWLGVAAAAGGFGIWATHFIAMLAFTPGMPSGYDLDLTLLSLVYAVGLTGLGLAIGLWARLPLAAWIGGALVGGGVAAMHYTGMAAFEVNGRIVWDPILVVTSIAIGAALGGCALAIALGGRGFRRQIRAATLLLLAICGHHFTAMGAVTIVPDPLVVVTPSAIPSAWLAIAVALASLAILLFAGAAVAIDMRDRQRAATEGERLRSLANAAIEGLLVCRGDQIVSANESFTTLVGLPSTSCTGLSLSQFLPAQAARTALTQTHDQAIEAELTRSDGELIPVEVISRPVEYARKAHYAIAVRDIRARRQAEGEIKFLALHDGLTGLANRTSFNARPTPI